jgi:hypothetical protein
MQPDYAYGRLKSFQGRQIDGKSHPINIDKQWKAPEEAQMWQVRRSPCHSVPGNLNVEKSILWAFNLNDQSNEMWRWNACVPLTRIPQDLNELFSRDKPCVLLCTLYFVKSVRLRKAELVWLEPNFMSVEGTWGLLTNELCDRGPLLFPNCPCLLKMLDNAQCKSWQTNLTD